MTVHWPWTWIVLLPLAAGCAAARVAPALPARNSLVLDQLVVYSDFALPQRHRLLEELVGLRGSLSTRLGLPLSDEPIHVYLFQTPELFRDFAQLHYPEFPDRRAFFVESDTRLMVYACWGDRVAEDLRHETAHGYLHAVLTNLPLWLDEGLAEYFEVPRGQSGLNRLHLESLAAGLRRGWRPDLRRLEALRHAGEMVQDDYAEAWAWVHFLLESTPPRRELLQAYLQSLRSDAAVESLSQRLRALHLDYERQLVEHLNVIAQHLR
jgi:hypothetical protein